MPKSNVDEKGRKKNPHEGHRQRLREKVDRDPELETMHEHELLELLLSFVIPRKDTNEIAHDLIDKFGSLDSVFFATPRELLETKNMTVSAAYLIATQLPIARRAMRTVDYDTKQRRAGNVENALDAMHSYFYARKTECFAIAVLDINQQLIKMLYKKGDSATDVVVYTSEILLSATREGAAYVVVGHNHPSGVMSPSDNDIMLTHQLYDALENMDIHLLDHVIFSHTGYFSFNNNGLLELFRREFYKREAKHFNEDPEERKKLRLMLDEFVLVPSTLAHYPYEVVDKREYNNMYKERMMNGKVEKLT